MSVRKYGPNENPPNLDGNTPSGIPGQVDQPSVAPIAEAGTNLPATVNSGGVAPRVDRPA